MLNINILPLWAPPGNQTCVTFYLWWAQHWWCGASISECGLPHFHTCWVLRVKVELRPNSTSRISITAPTPSSAFTWLPSCPHQPVSSLRTGPAGSLSPSSSKHGARHKAVLDTCLPTTAQTSLCARRQVVASDFNRWKIKDVGLHDLWGHFPVPRTSENVVVYRLAFHGSYAQGIIYNNDDNTKNSEPLLSP